MLVVSLNQQVQLINRSTGEAYDELNTGFSSDLRCTGMYPHVACTDYSVVKIWDWDPLKGTVATLVGSVSETESMLSLIFICFKEFTTLDIITSDSNLYTLLAITSALSISEQLKKRNLNQTINHLIIQIIIMIMITITLSLRKFSRQHPNFPFLA